MDREIGLVKAGHWQCFQMFVVLCELYHVLWLLIQMPTGWSLSGLCWPLVALEESAAERAMVVTASEVP
jgi:hypothetical protein